MSHAPSDWYADESLWADTYAFMFPDESFEKAVAQVDQLIELTAVQGGALLDMGCGPGRFSVPFAKRGFEVTGVDITPFLMQKALDYAKREGVRIELVKEDMRRFVRPDSFDLALSMLTTFGYFEDSDDDLTVLGNILTSLKPGGVFVFDTFGKEVLAGKYRDTSSKQLPDGNLIVQRREAVNDWSQMENEWLLIKDDRVRTLRLRHWLYSGHEFKQLLREAGFVEPALYGDLSGSAYGPGAERLVAVGRKPQ
ncbi:MAG: methyltransferase domain-containing protein [Gemmatimonadetes bacterium]|nr:methyltransferase domain-containing protein [Gemmatimonadota bacterium]